jgi:hypothetical protein
MVFGNAVFNASMAVFKKSCLPSSLTQVLNFKFCGDWLFWILVAKHGEVASIGIHLNYFRNHDKDVSQHSFKSGIFYDEYLKLQKVLLDQKIISFFTYKRALFERWQSLKTTEIETSVKINLLKYYRKNFNLFEFVFWLIFRNVWQPMLLRINIFFKWIFE